MGVHITHGDIKRLLRHFNMSPKGKKGNVYYGVHRDGRVRVAVFHYHKDNEQLPKGTANQIAASLGFLSSKDMAEYIKARI